MYRFLIFFAIMLALPGSVLGQRPANTTQPVRNQVPTAPLIEPIVQVGHANLVSYLAFTDDEMYLLSADTIHDGGTAILWDTVTGDKVREFVTGGDIYTLSPNGKLLIEFERIEYEYINGTIPRESHRLCIPYVWDVQTNNIKPAVPIRIESGHNIENERDDYLNREQNSAKIECYGGDFSGRIKLFNTTTGEELCSLYSFGDGTDWLVITPQGLFDGTPGGRRLVAYRVGKGLNVQPVEAFFQDFYYPGLLAAIWTGERPMPSVKVKEQLPPEIQFITPTQPGEVRGDKASFEVLITDQGGDIQKPYVKQNGVPVRVRTVPVTTGNTMRWSFELQLVEGDNEIVVHSATADGQIACKSMPLVLHSIQREIVTPSLYILAVGISDYQDGDNHDLPCARRDAEVLAEVFKRRGEAFYGVGKVHVRPLVDSQATINGIQQAMQEIAAAAKPEDVFVLMLSGHGATVGSLYHFLPYEFKFSGDTVNNLVKAQGIADDVLSDWISAIPAMKRVLIYDTCQSGAVTRSGMEHHKAMERLANMTGSHTIAAAAGKEVANELPDVGHGALTYALLAGMGEAKTGILQRRNVVGSDGNVNVRDLFNFAQDEVPNLTRLSFGTEQRVVLRAGEYNYPLLGKP